MTKSSSSRKLSRRSFLKLSGGSLAAATGTRWLTELSSSVSRPQEGATTADATPDVQLGVTDGWFYLPPKPAIPQLHPHPLAPAPFTTYFLGLRDVTGLKQDRVERQQNKAQYPAPLFWTKQEVPFWLQFTDLGLADIKPLSDSQASNPVVAPGGGRLSYAYSAHEPGSYIYHYHLQGAERFHVSMSGLILVRPAQDGDTTYYPSGRYVCNDGNGSTGYDREFVMLLSEVWATAHRAAADLQLPGGRTRRGDFYLLNGRVYPDTLAPNGATDPANGDLIPPEPHSGERAEIYAHLQYQPLSSLVQCNAGERVLLRFANLGFKRQSMTLSGIDMEVVCRNSTLPRGGAGRGIPIGARESVDAIFTAPTYQGPGPFDTYLLYNPGLSRANNLSPSGFSGQMTEVHVFPPGTLGPQTGPNA
jgi:hypothetical protein